MRPSNLIKLHTSFSPLLIFCYSFRSLSFSSLINSLKMSREGILLYSEGGKWQYMTWVFPEIYSLPLKNIVTAKNP